MTSASLAPNALPLADDPLSPFSLPKSFERQRIGRAYNLAQEIAPYCADATRIVDVGCGTGFVSYHLGATLDCEVVGADIAPAARAPIDYRRFDGRWLPFTDASFDAAICTFVLHHSQDAPGLLREMHRVVRPGGTLILYEDLPTTSWDRLFCRLHDRRWRARTGPCHFRSAHEWTSLCTDTGFAPRSQTVISRFRDFTHPVQRCQLVATRIAPRRTEDSAWQNDAIRFEKRSSRRNHP